MRASSEPDRRRSLGHRLLGDQGQTEEGGVVIESLEHPPDQRAQALGRFGVPFPVDRDGLEQLIEHPLETGPQQFVTVGEVDIDGGASHPGFGGDLVHGDLGGPRSPNSRRATSMT